MTQPNTIHRYDYSRLRGKIVELFKTQQAFSTKLGVANTTLSRKLNCGCGFTSTEIDGARQLLGIPDSELSSYFFTPAVDICQQ